MDNFDNALIVVQAAVSDWHGLLDCIEGANDAWAMRPKVLAALFSLVEAGEALRKAAYAVRERL